MVKIVVIKLGAKGDVIRTLPIAKALKEKYPDCELTWITKENIADLVSSNEYIDKVLTIPVEIKEIKDKFDILYNFDVEKEATSLAVSIEAGKKYGFYSEGDYPSAFNPKAEYYINTIFDDALKKANKKTYQEMMFETAELPYKKEPIEIELSEKDKKFGEEFLIKNNLKNKKILGIHMGASPRWPSKVWHKDRLKEFCAKAKNDYEIILFGGPDEIKQLNVLARELEIQNIKIYTNNPNNTNKEFAALVSLCDKFVCSESFSLHMSLALKKPTFGLFFCTSPAEIEGYGLLTKIIAPKLYEFFPEKSDKYDEDLVKSISAEDVLNTIKEQNNSNKPK